MKVLLIDNYDSFVYNIVGLLQGCRQKLSDLEWDVVKCDRISLEDIVKYDAVILSPGPGLPSEAGLLIPLIHRCATDVPILGICLGCQAIAEHFGCRLRRLESPRHGHCSALTCVDKDDPVVGFYYDGGRVGRYHSWVIDEESLHEEVPVVITSRDDDGNIMSIRHRNLPIFGVQFHPESIISTGGLRLLINFLTCRNVK